MVVYILVSQNRNEADSHCVGYEQQDESRQDFQFLAHHQKRRNVAGQGIGGKSCCGGTGLHDIDLASVSRSAEQGNQKHADHGSDRRHVGIQPQNRIEVHHQRHEKKTDQHAEKDGAKGQFFLCGWDGFRSVYFSFHNILPHLA